MTTAEMMRAQIREQALSFDPIRQRAEKRMTDAERRDKAVWESWKRHLAKRVTAYRDLR